MIRLLGRPVFEGTDVKVVVELNKNFVIDY